MAPIPPRTTDEAVHLQSVEDPTSRLVKYFAEETPVPDEGEWELDPRLRGLLRSFDWY